MEGNVRMWACDIDVLMRAFERAKDKLYWIIEREGDAAGERLKDYYFYRLWEEEVSAVLLADRCLGN